MSVLRCIGTTAAKVAHPAGPESKRAAETFPGDRPGSTWCSKTAAKVGQPAVASDNTGGASSTCLVPCSSINSNFSLVYILELTHQKNIVIGVLEIFKPHRGFAQIFKFLGVWKYLFRGFDFEICQIGVLIFGITK